MTSSPTNHAAKKAIPDRDIRSIPRDLRARRGRRHLPRPIFRINSPLSYPPEAICSIAFASGARNLLFHLRTRFIFSTCAHAMLKEATRLFWRHGF